MTAWPNQSQSALNAFYGNPDANKDGAPDLKWQQENLTTITPPYPMFYDGKKVSKISCHKLISESLLRVLTKIKAITTADERKQYGLDQFGGVFNFRRKRGGSGLSTHSWAIAIDLAVALNQFGWAYGSRPNMMPAKVVAAFEEEGATWGGLWSNPDAMHFQWADIPGGTRKPAATPAPAAAEPTAAVGISDKATVEQVQARLKELGYTEVGDVDGRLGDLTETAILAFRKNANLPLVPIIDTGLLLALMQAKPRELAPARVDAKPAEVRQQVPEARAAWWTQIGAWALGVPAAIGTAVSGVLDNIDGSRGFLEPVKQFAGDVPPWLWFLSVGGVALFLWLKSRQAQAAITTAYQTGERR